MSSLKEGPALQGTHILEQMSMLYVEPILTDFLFAEIHSSVDMYAIVRVKPIRNLSQK